MHHEQLLGLQAQLKEMSTHLEGLEKERDFYFAKVGLSFYVFIYAFYSLGSPILIAARYRDLGAVTDGRSR